MECARGWRPPTRIAEFAARLFISSTAWMQRCVVVTCQCPRIDSCRLGVVGPVEYGTSGALIARDLDPAGCGASRQLCVSLPATSRPDECTSPEACWRTAECGAVSGKVGPGALCGRQSRMSRSRCGSLCRGRQHATAPSRPVPAVPSKAARHTCISSTPRIAGRRHTGSAALIPPAPSSLAAWASVILLPVSIIK